MAGRPPLAPGTFGEIGYVQLAPGKWQARARFRDQDGRTRLVGRTGQTKARAKTNLKTALAQRQADTSGLSRDSRVNTLADAWLERVDDDLDKHRSARTKEHYAYTIDRYIRRGLGELRVSEATTARCGALLDQVRREHGPGAAKSTRSVLSGMFRLAVQHGALTINPLRETSAISIDTDPVRALTPEETTYLTDRLRTMPRAVDLDLPDLVDVMLYTGCRIGETLALRDAVFDRAGTLEINATTIRTKADGLHIQEKPKTAAGWRVIAVPEPCAMLIERRRTQLRFRAAEAVIFPSAYANSLRDPSNTAADLRETLDAIDCDQCAGTGWQLDAAGGFVRDRNRHKVRCTAGPFSWVTSHTFRKTVATRLLDAGVAPHLVADHLGHENPSMTLDRYAGRNVVNAQAATVLDRR